MLKTLAIILGLLSIALIIAAITSGCTPNRVGSFVTDKGASERSAVGIDGNPILIEELTLTITTCGQDGTTGRIACSTGSPFMVDRDTWNRYHRGDVYP